MFEQAELQGTQMMGPNGPPVMQKERLKSPQKSQIIENQVFWVISSIGPKQPFWSFWPANGTLSVVAVIRPADTRGHTRHNAIE